MVTVAAVVTVEAMVIGAGLVTGVAAVRRCFSWRLLEIIML